MSEFDWVVSLYATFLRKSGILSVFGDISYVLASLVHSVLEAGGIRHNDLYSVNCTHIACRSENITVLGSPQVCDKRVLLQFFYTTHFIAVLGKESKS